MPRQPAATRHVSEEESPAYLADASGYYRTLSAGFPDRC